MEYLIVIGLAIVGLAIGFFSGKTAGQKLTDSTLTAAKSEAEQLVQKAKIQADAQAKEIEFTAKERALQLKSDVEREVLQKQKNIEEIARRTKQAENTIQQKSGNLKKREQDVGKFKEKLTKQMEQLDSKKANLDQLQSKNENERKALTQQKEEFKKREQKLLAEIKQKEKEALKAIEVKEEASRNELAQKLEAVAGLTADEAKNQLIETMTKKAETEAMAFVKDQMDEAKQRATREAKKIIIQTIQRTAAEHAIENAVTVFNLNSDDIKGQIIGREGRNIRALEAATGVEIIVDDTPEAVVISGYDPYRREVARLSLKRLVADGRIHPARIEEIVNKTKKQLDQEITEIGERTIIELNLHGLHPKLIQLVGRMRFRSSYGQNLLQHSKETANICAIMASELGLSKKSVKMAKRAGLLHDIGKVSEENPELSHAILGMELCKRYHEKEPIVNAVGAHHDEVEMTHMISPIVQAADAISGSRPGARREILETYLQRLKELEELAAAYDGVQKTYAIQAGRELRVIVESENVSDKRTEELAFEISQKIQAEMQYPGQIKVTVIRERRAVGIAK